MLNNSNEPTQAIKERVIRAYNKGMDFDIITKLICPRKFIKPILEEAGIEIRKMGSNWLNNRLDLRSKK